MINKCFIPILKIINRMPQLPTGIYFGLKRWKCDDSPSFPPHTPHWWHGWPLGEPGQSHCLWLESSLGSRFSKGLSVPPKQEAFTSEENWRRGRLCWWCSCHILLVHGCVSPGTGGMSVIDRNCIIKLDKILTLSWQCNLFIKQKDFRKLVTWNLELRSSSLGIFRKSNW